MNKIISKKGQELGSLGWMLIALLCISAVATLSLDYIHGLAFNYGVNVNESQYVIFQQIGDVNSTISDISSQLIPEDPGQPDTIDVIDSMISGAWGAIKLFFHIPILFAQLIQAGVVSLGISSSSAGVLSALLTGVIMIMTLVGIIALILKVRA